MSPSVYAPLLSGNWTQLAFLLLHILPQLPLLGTIILPRSHPSVYFLNSCCSVSLRETDACDCYSWTHTFLYFILLSPRPRIRHSFWRKESYWMGHARSDRPHGESVCISSQNLPLEVRKLSAQPFFLCLDSDHLSTLNILGDPESSFYKRVSLRQCQGEFSL